MAHSKHDQKVVKVDLLDREAVKIDLLKHICLVSLLSMIFIGEQFDPGSSSITRGMLKCAVSSFLVSVIAAVFALFLKTANYQLPENSSDRRNRKEYNMQRISTIFCILFFLLGCLIFGLHVWIV